MSPILLFLVLLVITFAVILWKLAPSKREADIQRHLKEIGNLYGVDAAGANILKQESLSAVPWINGVLLRIPGTRNLQLFITQADSTWSVGTLLLSSIVMVFFGTWFATFVVPGIWVGLIIGLAVGSLPYTYLYLKRQARFRRLDVQLPEAIDLISRALRAGHAVISAIEIVSQ